MKEIVGREVETGILNEMFHSDDSEFLAIYGRRRVGKTYLIRTFFGDQEAAFFDITGAKNVALKVQIRHFTQEIGRVFYGHKRLRLSPGKNWDETFELLTEAIDQVAENKKIILFFDEFPWLATKNSRLILMSLKFYQ